MLKTIFRNRNIAVLLTTVGAAGAIAAFTTATAAADGHGRTITAGFCLLDHPTFCMRAGLDGQAPVEGYGVDGNAGTCALPGSAVGGPQNCVPSETGFLGLRPGMYSITVVDDQTKHNFSFRSCPGSRLPCTESNPDAILPEEAITTIPEVATRTIQVNLEPGWYRLFCDADSPVNHEKAGMYIDFEVGGTGR